MQIFAFQALFMLFFKVGRLLYVNYDCITLTYAVFYMTPFNEFLHCSVVCDFPDVGFVFPESQFGTCDTDFCICRDGTRDERI